jgi:hypothetical protein
MRLPEDCNENVYDPRLIGLGQVKQCCAAWRYGSHARTRQGSATGTEVARRFGRAHSGLSRSMNRLRDETDK